PDREQGVDGPVDDPEQDDPERQALGQDVIEDDPEDDGPRGPPDLGPPQPDESLDPVGHRPLGRLVGHYGRCLHCAMAPRFSRPWSVVEIAANLTIDLMDVNVNPTPPLDPEIVSTPSVGYCNAA